MLSGGIYKSQLRLPDMEEVPVASKQETQDSGILLSQLKALGYFRKTNDVSQIGLPDIIGNIKGRFFGIEAKSVDEVPEDGIVPKKGNHAFTKTQVKELTAITESGGVGLGVIICGKHALWVFVEDIDDDGRVEWDESKEMIQNAKGVWPIVKTLKNLKINI